MIVAPRFERPLGPARRVATRLATRVKELPRPPRGLILVIALVVLAGAVHAVGMARSPAALDDEGTYVAQAWAVQRWQALAHYTYWYDHPPLGWIQIALWTTLTGAFDRYDHAVIAGREAMLVAHTASCALLYVLARRIGMRRPTAAVAVVLFSLCPLAVAFHRHVFLDNIAITWLLAAFVLAASPQRRLSASAGAAACFVIAALTKETTLILLPALVWQLWSHADRRSRHFALALFGGLFVSLLTMYPLFAILRNELFPGDGHVSLLWAIEWQLTGRASTGSIIDAGSASRGVLDSWLRLDPWLLVLGAFTMPLAFTVRRLRPVACALAIQVVMLFRDGYLPYPYVIAMLPFAALLAGGVLDAVWGRAAEADPGASWLRSIASHKRARLARRGAVVLAAVMFAALVTPSWAEGLDDQMTTHRTIALQQAVEWLDRELTYDDVVVVDDSLWVDVVESGMPAENVIWFYKLDLDPGVHLEHGWRDIDYLVLGDLSPSAAGLPTLSAAIDHSELVASFGTGPDALHIRRVQS